MEKIKTSLESKNLEIKKGSAAKFLAIGLFTLQSLVALPRIVNGQETEKFQTSESTTKLESNRKNLENIFKSLQPRESVPIPEIGELPNGSKYLLGMNNVSNYKSSETKIIISIKEQLNALGVKTELVEGDSSSDVKWLEDCAIHSVGKDANGKLFQEVILANVKDSNRIKEARVRFCENYFGSKPEFKVRKAEFWNYDGGDMVTDINNKKVYVGLNTFIEMIPRVLKTPIDSSQKKYKLGIRNEGLNSIKKKSGIPQGVDSGLVISRCIDLLKTDLRLPKDFEIIPIESTLFHLDEGMRVFPREFTNIDPKLKGLIILPDYSNTQKTIKLLSEEINKIRSKAGLDPKVFVSSDLLIAASQHQSVIHNKTIFEQLGYKVILADSNLQFELENRNLKINSIMLNGIYDNGKYIYTEPSFQQFFGSSGNEIFEVLEKYSTQASNNFSQQLSQFGINAVGIKSKIALNDGSLDCLTAPDLTQWIKTHNNNLNR